MLFFIAFAVPKLLLLCSYCSYLILLLFLEGPCCQSPDLSGQAEWSIPAFVNSASQQNVEAFRKCRFKETHKCELQLICFKSYN